MNIIKTSVFEGDYICSICRESFTENDKILLVKHHDNITNKIEKIDRSRKRKHIFHESCMMQYIESNTESCENSNIIDENELICPLDREKIDRLIAVRYYEIAALNIVNFSHNYYELLDKFNNKNIAHISIIDRINLNYKDINGKTLLYCVCQRGDLKLLKKLIKLGGNPTISDDNGFTPLMASVTHNFLHIVKHLLKLQEIIDEINYIDEKGKTAIEYADEYLRFQCIIELLKVNGINHITLTKLLNKYQNIKFNDIKYSKNYSIIMEIKNKIKKYLKIPLTTKNDLKKLNMNEVITNKIPKSYQRTDPRQYNQIKILNVDIEENPEVLDWIYKPIENKNSDGIQCVENELTALRYYNEIKPDLIYQPLPNFPKKY